MPKSIRQTADTNKKRAILKATLQLIRNNGFHNAPMAQVAKEAGVGTGTIYHHFESKEQIIAALYAQEKERMGSALLRGDKPKENYRERFYRFWNNLFRHYIQHPDGFLFLEQYSNSPFITNHTRDENIHFYRPVIDFLNHGIEQGILRNMHIELMVALVYGNVVSCVKLHLEGTLKMNTSLIQQAIKATWDSVRIN